MGQDRADVQVRPGGVVASPRLFLDRQSAEEVAGYRVGKKKCVQRLLLHSSAVVQWTLFASAQHEPMYTRTFSLIVD